MTGKVERTSGPIRLLAEWLPLIAFLAAAIYLWRSDLAETSLAGESPTHEQWDMSVPLPVDSPLFVRLRFSIF